MKKFFDDDVLLDNYASKELYKEVKDLPIIDYHCHLDDIAIKNDENFSDIGELWLKGDHYKWRAMRICGVDEEYITGSKTFKEKFIAYCSIMPKLIGNPLYYWSHFELKQIFNINLEINKNNAEEIYDLANEKLKDLSVIKLLKKFNVEFIATTDDPISSLQNHGIIEGIQITPTFRPDKLYNFEDEYLSELSKSTKIEINTIDDLLEAIRLRLDYFTSKGCKISDHGFEDFPASIASKEEAELYFKFRKSITADQKDALFGYLLVNLFAEYKKRNILVQLHFAVKRNINTPMFKKLGPDHGFDVMSHEINLANLIKVLDYLDDESRPTIILYSLNPNSIAALSCIAGAYRNIYIGAAWWFNDTLEGIKNNLKLISEYNVLGTSLGMLTDSRSFSSYSRFDFFRRILCSFVGEFVEKGEYSLISAKELVRNICYFNIKELLKI